MEKQKKSFADVLRQMLYREEEVTENVTVPSEEEMAEYEGTLSSENGENVDEMAKKIITESQIPADNDDIPDISNVQKVLETVGAEAANELVKNILINFSKCDPEALVMDGTNRRQAILDAISQVNRQNGALKLEKAAEEETLVQEEKNAETTCADTITEANNAAAEAIRIEKERSAAVIADIRKAAEEATAEAKRVRDETLSSIADKRTANEAELAKSDELVVATETYGQTVIAQIDIWLGYLK